MEENFATELLREIKLQSKRWFIAFLIVLALWFATIGIFIWYISLPVEEYNIEQDAQYGERNIQIVGGSNYGQTESDVQTQSD